MRYEHFNVCLLVILINLLIYFIRYQSHTNPYIFVAKDEDSCCETGLPMILLNAPLLCSVGRYFIGLGDMNVEGVYKWPGGVDSPYKNWAQSHPQSGPDCVVINLSHASDLTNGKWMSENCQNNYRFICECPGACS